jgi:nucleotide-binding universal stress UspA family protein
MSHIILATDFSEAADNALLYACQLAQDHHADLQLVHSFMIPVNVSENPMPIMPMDEGMEIAKARMNTLLQEHQAKFPQIAMTSKVSYGEIVDVLQEMIAEAEPLMVVLGNYTAHDDFIWLGSSLVSAMRHVNVPVLGIPVDYAYKKIEKICYSCDFKNNDDTALAQKLIQLVNATKAQLHVLYIDNKNNESSETLKVNMQGTPFHTTLLDINPTYHFVEKESIEAGIENFIVEQQIDWLVVVPHKHSFFDSLFKKSHTKSIARKSSVPIMALHGYE